MTCLADGCYQYGEGAQHKGRRAKITDDYGQFIQNGEQNATCS